jgi:hypothetical protein
MPLCEEIRPGGRGRGGVGVVVAAAIRSGKEGGGGGGGGEWPDFGGGVEICSHEPNVTDDSCR